MFGTMTHMKIIASNSTEASKQILRTVAESDYKYASNKGSFYRPVFVYFSSEHCRFYFEIQQRNRSTEMVKRFSSAVDLDEVISIVANKHTFPQIAVGAILSRKIMSPIDFFSIAREHFEWL